MEFTEISPLINSITNDFECAKIIQAAKEKN